MTLGVIAFTEVEMFQYTVHVPCSGLEAKADGILIRRGIKGFTLLSYLFLSEHVLKLNSDTLSELLSQERIRMPKNSTRKAKILGLMKTATVQDSVADNILQGIVKKMEERRPTVRNERPPTTTRKWTRSRLAKIREEHVFSKTCNF